MPAEIRRGAEAALPGDLLDRQGTGLQQFAGAQDALLGEPFNVPFVIFAVIAGAAVLPRQAGRGVARRPDVAGPARAERDRACLPGAHRGADLTMSRQVGSALGVGILVSVVGTHPAGTASFGHAWILVLTAAVMTGLARLASSGPKAASQQMDTTRPAVQRTGAGAE